MAPEICCWEDPISTRSQANYSHKNQHNSQIPDLYTQENLQQAKSKLTCQKQHEILKDLESNLQTNQNCQILFKNFALKLLTPDKIFAKQLPLEKIKFSSKTESEQIKEFYTTELAGNWDAELDKYCMKNSPKITKKWLVLTTKKNSKTCHEFLQQLQKASLGIKWMIAAPPEQIVVEW